MKYAYRITATAIGCVLGAGFLSGQELLTFFGAYGAWGYVGAVVAALFFYLTVSTVLTLAYESRQTGTDRIVLAFDLPAARYALLVFEVIFLFLIYVLMIAAAGSLLFAVFGLPVPTGNLLFCTLTVVCALTGIKGLVRVFSWLVPCLVLAALAVACGSLLQEPVAPAVFEKPDLAFIPSALVYVSFNIVCSIPILAPVGKDAPTKASIRCGTAIASLVLTGIALVILFALTGKSDLAQNDLPMLALSGRVGAGVGTLYACLLFGGIFSTGFSSMTALGSYATDRFHLSRPKTALVLIVLSLAGVGVALSGFRKLVAFFYPVFGYIGLVPLALLFLHAFLRRRAKKSEKQNKRVEKRQEFPAKDQKKEE